MEKTNHVICTTMFKNEELQSGFHGFGMSWQYFFVFHDHHSNSIENMRIQFSISYLN